MEKAFNCKLNIRFYDKNKNYDIEKILEAVNNGLNIDVVNLYDSDGNLYDIYFSEE